MYVFVLVCMVKTVHSFLLNVTLLNSILYPNCSFVHVCLCSHFGSTNVCFFFCFLSYLPHFIYLFIYYLNVMSSCVALASPSLPRPPLPPPLSMCWCWRCPLSLTLLHTSGLQYNMAPTLFQNLCSAFFFSNLFLPLVLYFFTILVSDSSRQSWESTMPPPVSK